MVAISFAVIFIGEHFYSKYKKTPLPVKPLIIIEITAVRPSITQDAYRYKLIDRHGHLFYITESATYNEQPKRMLGDSIK
jgi:hypothetical protein